MKKSVKIGLIILMVMALILPITYSYATEKILETETTETEETSFFEISELEVSKNGKIEMTINLDEIEYDKFIFELESSENIEDVELDEDNNSSENGETLEIETTDNEIIIEIDKENTSLSTIVLYYQIPDTVEVDNTIKFIATITNVEDEEETVTIETEVTIIDEEEDNNQTSNSQTNDNKNEENTQQIQEAQQGSTEKQQSEQNNSDNSSKQSTETSTTSKNSQDAEETVTYNGSDNNYLSELSIEGYTLNKEFSKDNSTYFLTVENDVDLLDITTTVDDDSAAVYVYGNEDLSEGTNKILISVVAENGNVRNYRIYVTKNS